LAHKSWSLGAKAALKKISSEFEELLEEKTEEFVEHEGRQTINEEDVKIALVDLHKRLAAEEISLPSSRFTTNELLKGLQLLRKMKK